MVRDRVKQWEWGGVKQWEWGRRKQWEWGMVKGEVMMEPTELVADMKVVVE